MNTVALQKRLGGLGESSLDMAFFKSAISRGWGAELALADMQASHGVAQGLHNSLKEILHQRLLTPVYQPIVDLAKIEIYGFEGLIRGPKDSPLHAPMDLFEAAKTDNLMLEVEHLSRQVVLEHYAKMSAGKKLFVNLSPSMLLQSQPNKGETIVYVNKLGLNPRDVIIEITEQSPNVSYAELVKAVESYRDMGFEIAMDDLGEGFSSLRLWSEIKPNYVKIDKHFTRNIHQDQVKFEFVRSIQQIAENSGAKVVAEGIETKDELMVIKDLKIMYGQGYLFGRPEPHLIKSVEQSVKNILNRNAVYIYHNSSISVDNKANVSKLLKYVEPAKSSATNNEIMGMFEVDKTLNVLPVVDGDKPIGLISRFSMIDNLVRPYRRELFGKRLCADTFMDKQPLIVEKSISLKALSDMITEMEPHHFTNGFIITDNGRYLGLGKGHDLLREITQMQINAARYANPITMLPGNVPIAEQIDRLIESSCKFCVCYFDLDSFKPFNDAYGFRRGDDVIQYTAKLLMQHINKEYDFVGHVGGDDFYCDFPER
jgi:EAL domain-containing protein (putative c-di-GMP-specific phosphodiesterase class I)